jgi:hypothetical protein
MSRARLWAPRWARTPRGHRIKPMPTEPTLADIARQFAHLNVEKVRGFVPPDQLAYIIELMDGEEGAFFAEKITEIAQIIETMPTTYQTDGQGMKAVAHLHYFGGPCDWYITEKDRGDPADSPEDFQCQAFGRVNLGVGDGPESGYISLPEIFTVKKISVELDLHWNPRPLETIRKCRV